MSAKCVAEILVLPYSTLEGHSLLKRLVAELADNTWTHFRAAVAFARVSGNFPALLEALRAFAHRGGRIQLTFGADLFGAEQSSSDREAIIDLLTCLDAEPSAEIFIYTEPGRTFHPKLYVFSNDESALVIVGSSNWTGGGLENNIEANVLLRFDLTDADAADEFEKLMRYFDEYWREVEPA